MLFDERFWPGLADGSITVAFRRWKRPTVRTGGSLLWAGNQFAIDSVATIAEQDITDADAARAGYTCLDELLLIVNKYEGTLYRIDFHLLGPDPRIALREDDVLSDADIDDVLSRLTQLDRASAGGPWTAKVMRLIEERPGVLAAKLGASIDEPDLARFKARVRRLKALGLTESLPAGYRLSPRGEALLARLE